MEFECNITLNDIINYDDIGEQWGAGYIWCGDKGVEYNLCIENEDNSAIYKMEYNTETDYWETDYDTFEHYEINPNNPNWKLDFKEAMVKALFKFFKINKGVKNDN